MWWNWNIYHIVFQIHVKKKFNAFILYRNITLDKFVIKENRIGGLASKSASPYFGAIVQRRT